MSKILIEHRSSHGSVFSSTSKDLSTGVIVRQPFRVSNAKIMQDYFEFGCWFTVTILPGLSSFQGYDAVNFIYQEMEKCNE